MFKVGPERGFLSTMFTGIITNLGKVSEKMDNKLSVKTVRQLVNKLSKGASIAMDGICLTVVDKSDDQFSADFMPETEARTNIKYLRVGDLVNLELPATPDSFLSGHIIQGHIDGVAKLIDMKKSAGSYLLRFELPQNLFKYFVEKGAITINGISLTITLSVANNFTVGIIPHTFKNTMLQKIKIGDFVNIEIDILAKYIKKLI